MDTAKIIPEWHVQAPPHGMVLTDDAGWLSQQPDAVRDCLAQTFKVAAFMLWDQLSRPVEVEVALVNNAAIAELNEKYREKPMPTDVLSFPQLESLLGIDSMPYPGVVSLGNVVISVEWAQLNAAQDERVKGYPDPVVAFVMDRLCHGLQHISGRHHATMPDFEAVVAFQNHVLAQVFPGGIEG